MVDMSSRLTFIGIHAIKVLKITVLLWHTVIIHIFWYQLSILHFVVSHVKWKKWCFLLDQLERVGMLLLPSVLQRACLSRPQGCPRVDEMNMYQLESCVWLLTRVEERVQKQSGPEHTCYIMWSMWRTSKETKRKKGERESKKVNKT
jgi:hypothetical protein